MMADERKQLAIELLMACDKGDPETVDRLTNDDFHFQFMEKAASWSAEGQEVSTRLDKLNFLKFGVGAAKQVTRDGFHFKVDQAICEGNVVALFGTSNATSHKGKPYRNNYCWKITFAGDRVSEFLEFTDTHHAHEVLFE